VAGTAPEQRAAPSQLELASAAELSADRKLKTLRDALESLRAGGGDRGAENDILGHIRRLHATKLRLVDPVSRELVVVAASRARGQQEERKDFWKKQAELLKCKEDVKAAKVVLETTKAEGRAVAAEARAVVAQAKAAANSLKDEKRLREAEDRARGRHYAGRAAEAVRLFIGDAANVQALTATSRAMALDNKVVKLGYRTVRAPSFWPRHAAEEIDITIYPWDRKQSKATTRSFASNDFRWELFGRRKQADRSEACPKKHFQKLVASHFPFYSQLLGTRYPVLDIMQSHGGNLDLSYVEINWRYSRLLGPTRFPPGIHDWPPTAGWSGEGLAGSAATSPGATSSGARNPAAISPAAATSLAVSASSAPATSSSAPAPPPSQAARTASATAIPAARSTAGLSLRPAPALSLRPAGTASSPVIIPAARPAISQAVRAACRSDLMAATARGRDDSSSRPAPVAMAADRTVTVAAPAAARPAVATSAVARPATSPTVAAAGAAHPATDPAAPPDPAATRSRVLPQTFQTKKNLLT